MSSLNLWESKFDDIAFKVVFHPFEIKKSETFPQKMQTERFFIPIQNVFVQYLKKLQKGKEFLEKTNFFPLELMKVVTNNAPQELVKLVELKNAKTTRPASKRICSIKRHPMHPFLTNNCLRHCQHTPKWNLCSFLESFFNLKNQLSWNTFDECQSFSQNFPDLFLEQGLVT